jgi:hypothetical protein
MKVTHWQKVQNYKMPLRQRLFYTKKGLILKL